MDELPGGVILRRGVRGDGASVISLWAKHDEIDEGAVATDVILDHLFDRAEVVIAEADGAVVGFGATIRVGTITHLTDLFVVRDRQGMGIGRALLRAAFGDAVDRTTFSSADPRALPLYVRAGMRPWWPNLYLEAAVESLTRLTGGRTRVEHALLDAGEAGAAGRALGDADRGPDYAHWERRPGGFLFGLRVHGTPAAVGAAAERLRGDGARLLRLVVARDAQPVAAVLAMLQVVGERLGPVAFTLPGPHPALATLLEAGVRIRDRDTFMASCPGLVVPDRLLPHPAYL